MLDSPKNNANTTLEDHPHKDLVETVVEGVEGIDEPMEDSHPNAPAMLALCTYPVALVAALLGGLAFWFLFR